MPSILAMLSNVSASQLLTAQDVERISIPGKVTELIHGRLVVREPPGTRHGAVAATLAYLLSDFVRRGNLGAVYAQDTGFKIAADPDTVRAPDVAFVARERLGKIPLHGYAELAPDLLAEVVSPDDRPAEVLAKVADWLAAGARLVWIVDPERREVRVCRQDGSLSVLYGDDLLDGGDVLPGFKTSVTQILS